MATKADTLIATLSHAAKAWQRETQQPCVGTKGHEGTFSLEVVEPVLEALEWHRLPQRLGLAQTGAYYEWPSNNGVDVVLLDTGSPRAFVELKPTRGDCRIDLAETLAKRKEPRRLQYAVGGWFKGDPGFAIYTVSASADDQLSLCCTCVLSNPRSSTEALSMLALPVLCHGGDQRAWLQTRADGNPIMPRFRSRAMLAALFEILARELHLEGKLRLDYAFGDTGPHRPSFAFASLPGVLPDGTGVGLCVRATTNKLQCLFYNRSNRQSGRKVEQGLDSCCDESALRRFITAAVIPEIDRRRRLWMGG